MTLAKHPSTPQPGERESGETVGVRGQSPPPVSTEPPEAAANPSSAAPSFFSAARMEAIFESYKALLKLLDRRFEEQGMLDPLTWTQVDLEIAGHPGLSEDARKELHAHIENRMRLAGSGWG